MRRASTSPTHRPDAPAAGRHRPSDASGHPTARLIESAALVLLAPECALCGAPLDRLTNGPVCVACWRRVSFITPPVCDACGDPLPARQEWRKSVRCRLVCLHCAPGGAAVDRARALGAYDGTLRDLIHVMKYDRRPGVARQLGDLLARRESEVIEGADFSVPVPLHWRRHWTRGFNQAAELACRLPLPVVAALRRRRRTSAQVDLDAGARETNVAGAFALSWSMRPAAGWRRGLTRQRSLEGATVVLVDDVSTTGATLDACARVLKQAGVREVRALTVARTLRVRPGGVPRG